VNIRTHFVPAFKYVTPYMLNLPIRGQEAALSSDELVWSFPMSWTSNTCADLIRDTVSQWTPEGRGRSHVRRFLNTHTQNGDAT